MQFKLSISRTQNNYDCPKTIQVQIEDEASGAMVAVLKMLPEDFAKCVTGQGGIPAEVEHFIGRPEVIGKRREIREVELAMGTYTYGDARDPVFKMDVRRAVEAEGLGEEWELECDGFSRQAQRKHRIIMARYVEIEEEK